MTKEEAINIINIYLNSEVNYDESLVDSELTTYDFDWLQIAKEAIKYRVPRKPVCIKDYCFGFIKIHHYKCPHCHKILYKITLNNKIKNIYCSCCGQALDCCCEKE